MAADPYRNLVNANDQAVIAWMDAAGEARTSVADARCLRSGLESARMVRRPVKYQHRRNYEGYYWCAGSGESVWYESMTEYSVLMELDHTRDLAKVAAQPFCILFADGARHYPDYFALHASGRQVVYDVRPEGRVDEKAAVQFEKTRRVCEEVGWGYEVMHGVTGVQRHNLEWLAGYRHPYVDPGARERARIFDASTEQVPLAQLAVALDPVLPVQSLPGIYNLLWNQELTYEPSIPLGWHTLIERNKRG
ncbi:TnsA-like heteromeric transposase endonuclease subunit [Arthrobacter ramosus]|uniref:TnsA-like heteromeric transposase endonuclease subunit n=1 Tax=Arthrobacter ramosus TaxID=1672 RepID=A0ABV5Y579_ARTRM|nr:TnsA-like heteromeric transposase endonuclease subunit [Arthrobacter ramosus]